MRSDFANRARSAAGRNGHELLMRRSLGRRLDRPALRSAHHSTRRRAFTELLSQNGYFKRIGSR